MTLSQIALAQRARRSVKWIRAKGHVAFTVTNERGEKEVWESQRFSSGRLAGYKLTAYGQSASGEVAK